MAYSTIFANLPGSPATNPATLIDNMFNRVGQIAIVPCDTVGTNSLTLTPQANTPPIPAYTNHTPIFSSIAPNTSTGLVTAQIGSLASLPVFKTDGITQIGTNDIRANQLIQLVFESALNGGAGGFIALGIIGASAATGAINGSVQIKTTSYAVTNNDKGATITINNNSFFTISAGAAAGYDSNFQVRIYNGNSQTPPTAGIFINFPGLSFGTNNMLYPGQAIVIQNINSTWTAQNPPGRWLRSGTIFYISTAGSDTGNDGLSIGTAFLTPQGAYNNVTNIVDTQGGFATIQLAQTTFTLTGTLNINYPVVGRTLIQFKGDNTSIATAQTYIFSINVAAPIVSARDLSTVQFLGMFFQSTVAGAGVGQASNGATCDFNVCGYAGFTAGSNLFAAFSCGTINFLSFQQLATNFNNGLTAQDDGFLSGNGNWSLPSPLTFANFAVAVTGGVADFTSAVFSGAGSGAGSTGQQFAAQTAGGVKLGGVVLPGATPGVVTSPGWQT